MSHSDLERVLREALEASSSEAVLDQCTRRIAEEFAATTCTLHFLEDDVLKLRASAGLPPDVARAVQVVPIGKGMAGICAARREPVTVCNLQTDASGVVRPGARETKVHGGLVVPILSGTRLVGTLGVGKAEDHEYSPEEIDRLRRYGAAIADCLGI